MLLTLFRFLLVLVGTMSIAASAEAHDSYTYSPAGTLTMVAVSGSTAQSVVSVKNTSPGFLPMKLRVIGDESFTITPDDQFYSKLPYNGTLVITITYHATAGDVSNAILVMTALGPDVSDTINLVGRDSTIPHGWSTQMNDSLFGAYYGKPDSAWITVINPNGAPTTLTSSIIGTGFQVEGAQTRQIGTSLTERFLVRFVSSQPYAEATFRLTDGVKTREISLRGIKTSWAPELRDLVFGRYFGAGDSASVYISNYGSSPIQITGIIEGSAFAIRGEKSKTIVRNGTVMLVVDWLASVANPAEGKLKVTDGANTFEIMLHANGLPTSEDSVIVQGYYFGTIDPGDSSCGKLSVTNNTGGPITMTNASLIGGKQIRLKSTQTLPLILQPNESLEWDVCLIAPMDYRSDASATFEVEFLLNGSTRRRSASVSGSWDYCFYVQPRSSFGPLKRWESKIDTFSITSLRDVPITITDLAIEGRGSFTLLDNAPVTVSPRDSSFIRIKWDATGEVSQRVTLRATADCLTDESTLRANIATPISEQLSRPLWFGGDTSSGRITYHFYNDRPESISVLSVRLAQAKHFTITYISPLPPCVLTTNALLRVGVAFDGSAAITDDTLIIDVKDNLTSMRFPITMNTPSGVQLANESGLELQVSPNPSSGPFTLRLSGGSATVIEVYDMLGHLVDRVDPVSLTWNAVGLAKGAYYIRASGTRVEGTHAEATSQTAKHFTLTRQVVIE